MIFPEWFLFWRGSMGWLEMNEEAHSRNNYLSCWGALGIVQARRIAKREALHHLNFENFCYTNKTGS